MDDELLNDDELLVRLYDVGLGDCIYLRVPDRGGADEDSARHILIDCGNKFGTTAELEAAVADLEAQLPEAGSTRPGKKRLDLVVVTHAHEDHVRGFDPDAFRNIHIERLWMSAAMNPKHPQAEKSHALQAFALASLERLRSDPPNAALAGLAQSLFSLSKPEALKALHEDLPRASDIEPLFVHAETPEDELELFEDPDVHLRVLAPMEDIDGHYLGNLSQTLSELQALRGEAAPDDRVGEAANGREGEGAARGGEDLRPANVSHEDFQLLRGRLLDNALAFTLFHGQLVNNTSVVLLLEWRGRRLLFPGDAEVGTTRGGEYEWGRPNGSWNVLWAHRRRQLEQPLDFLKVGHHGSHNATPWVAGNAADSEPHPVNEILDALLPVPGDGERAEAMAVVSTRRTSSYGKIPHPALMRELGRRVANVTRGDEAALYPSAKLRPYLVPKDVDQPQRTDLEGTPYVDIRFSPRTP